MRQLVYQCRVLRLGSVIGVQEQLVPERYVTTFSGRRAGGKASGASGLRTSDLARVLRPCFTGQRLGAVAPRVLNGSRWLLANLASRLEWSLDVERNRWRPGQRLG